MYECNLLALQANECILNCNHNCGINPTFSGQMCPIWRPLIILHNPQSESGLWPQYLLLFIPIFGHCNCNCTRTVSIQLDIFMKILFDEYKAWYWRRIFWKRDSVTSRLTPNFQLISSIDNDCFENWKTVERAIPWIPSNLYED